ncbi:Hypothetical predicted protein [Marmota monax]|uniref:BTB domain-containing protein n=1 Tax=Marmota monax TaxID=9995 RepID=A0A5E4C3S0_MARMO|nr:Hypothetical predicted protein [Marmota monax]
MRRRLHLSSCDFFKKLTESSKPIQAPRKPAAASGLLGAPEEGYLLEGRCVRAALKEGAAEGLPHSASQLRRPHAPRLAAHRSAARPLLRAGRCPERCGAGVEDEESGRRRRPGGSGCSGRVRQPRERARAGREAPPALQQPNGRGADEETELEGLEPQHLEASTGAAAAAEETKELLLPQDAVGPTSLGGGGSGGPLLAERNRRTLAFRGGGGGGLGNNSSSRGRPETSAWPLRHFNGRGPAAVDLELDALEGKELMQDGASLSDSTEDEEEGASLGDGSGAEGGSCSSSRRSGGDGGDEAEGSDEQRKKDILCDVSIVVSGKIFKAHKNILVAGSRFFKTLYCVSNKESPNQNNTTHLDIAAVQGFSVILDFLYSGNLVLTSQNAIEVMTVASYLQMSEVVQTCRNFIKDALNISIKSEAPESVVVDYNNRKPVNRDGLSSRDQKIASFWATRNLTNLASNIKIENDGCNVDEGQIENYQMNDSNWVQDGSPELAENESQGQTKVFIWNNMVSQGIQDTGKTRRKNQTTKRFIYNIPPNNETNLEDCSAMQPPVAYPEENKTLIIKEEPDLDGALLSGPDGDRNMNANLLAEACSGQDGGDAGTSHDFKYGLMPGPSSDFKYGLIPGTSNDFKYGLLPGASNDFKYGLLPESWPKQETWENGESSLIMNKLKCPHCSYVAKYRRTLKRHLLIHTGVRSFSCDICGKLFTRREHVKRHSLVHKKDKKYKCMVCKKIFMLAASVGIRHGSRRYGVCVDCADKSQPGGQEGVDQGQDTEFPRDEEYEENEVGEADEELVDDGED